MSWTIEYFEKIRVEDRNNKCPNSKKGKKHKLEIWFGQGYCKRCGVKLK